RTWLLLASPRLRARLHAEDAPAILAREVRSQRQTRSGGRAETKGGRLACDHRLGMRARTAIRTLGPPGQVPGTTALPSEPGSLGAPWRAAGEALNSRSSQDATARISAWPFALRSSTISVAAITMIGCWSSLISR